MYDDAPIYGNGLPGRAPDSGVDLHRPRIRARVRIERTVPPERRLARKSNGTTVKLSFAGHALMENKNGLIVDLRLTTACGTAERNTVLEMLLETLAGTGRATVAADRAYDTRDFVRRRRAIGVTPHVSQDTKRKGGSSIDGRTTRHPADALSTKARKRIEEFFGWIKTVGGLRKSRLIGLQKTRDLATMMGAACNLLRIARLGATTA